MGVLLPLFHTTVLLSDAWTAVVIVPEPSQSCRNCCPRGGTAGDALADGAVGTAVVTSLICFRFLSQTCSLISPFFLHSRLDIHTGIAMLILKIF